MIEATSDIPFRFVARRGVEVSVSTSLFAPDSKL